MTPSDKELISGILKGDQKAIRRLHREYGSRLLSYARKKLPKEEDAEEIVQDSLLSAIYSLPSFRGRSSFSSWLFGIVHHEIADFYRKRKVKELFFSHFPFLSHLVDEALSPEVIMERERIEKKVTACLLSLAEGYHKILRLKYIEGAKTAEIAFELKISSKAVEMRLRRARLAFAKIWDEENQESFSFDDRRNLSFIKEHLGTSSSPLQDPSED